MQYIGKKNILTAEEWGCTFLEYIVFDMEWNQAGFYNARLRRQLGKFSFRLKGEVIQIGAVRLNEQGKIMDHFKIGIKPRFFSVMNKKIMQLTGIDQEMLASGLDFPTAIGHFQTWCGLDPVFLSWGPDDAEVLRQNLELHELDHLWFQRHFDLQKIFCIQVVGVANQQIALKKAVEHFAIDQSRVAHDALNDAFYAAWIGERLDLGKGIREYVKFVPEDILAGIECQKSMTFQQVSSKQEAFRKIKLTRSHCPCCDGAMQNEKLIRFKKRRYILLSHCALHGIFLVQLSFERDCRLKWTIHKRIYRANRKVVDFYRAEAKKYLEKQAAAQKAEPIAGAAEPMCQGL